VAYELLILTAESPQNMEVPMGTLLNLGTVSFTIPAWQMALYVTIFSLCMLWGKMKCCLLTTYAFAFYLGYYLFAPDFFTAAHGDSTAQSAYIAFGLVLAAFSLIAIFYEEQ
jgi:hypothetical protein